MEEERLRQAGGFASPVMRESPGATPTPRPYSIHVEEGVLDDLRQRLERTRWPRVAASTGWELGTSPAYLRELLDYWRTTYDWRREEAKLNAFAQFRVDIGGANLHFVHLKGAGPRPLPLLLLHGWPDSFYRFHKVIPRFSDPAPAGGDPDDSFDVVVPSLPGFPLTGPVPRTSDQQPTRQSAELIWRLMTEVLGYERFAVAGGDGGSVLAQILAIDHPEAVVGIHLTDLGWHVANVDPSSLSKSEQAFLDASKKRFMADGAYAMVQATRPRSLAAGLNDSPAGLASWIVDRFHSWSDSHGDIENSFSKDELLTNVMLYWVTQTIGSSIHTYFADTRSPSLTTRDRVNRPVGLALFPKDGAGVPPRTFAERTLNVQRWTVMPRGSHFAALEEPDLFADDVVEFFRAFRTQADARRDA
jgi:pimeloyl-ACP methyl ester carboxylesterase